MHAERIPCIILALLDLIIVLSFIPVELTIIYEHEHGKDRLDLFLGLFNGVFRFRTLSLRNLARRLIDPILQRFGLGGLLGDLLGQRPPGEGQPPHNPQGPEEMRARGTLVTRPGRRFRDLVLGFFKAELARDGLPCRDFEIILNIGTGDAALTGMLIGSLWAVVSPFIPKLGRFIRFERRRPRISIRPDFSARRLDVRFRCILRLNVGYIILRGIVRRAGALLKKGGSTIWQLILLKA